MASLEFSSKRLQIDRATATIVIFIAIASFVTVFSLVASRALLSQRSYQERVIKEKEQAKEQLEKNKKAVDELVVQYRSFVEAPLNILGGNPASAAGERDGDNARIILDALPSKYDFPALATSMDKILKAGNYKEGSFTGSDDEIAQSEKQPESNPQAVEIPFQMSIEGTYADIQNFILTLERSIRPIKIDTLSLDGDETNMSATVAAKTYYQPGKSLDFKTKDVQ